MENMVNILCYEFEMKMYTFDYWEAIRYRITTSFINGH